MCPPATVPPASATTSAPAAKIAAIASRGNSSGNAATLIAITTDAPIANTSLHAFAAAMAPKSAGSLTSGGKKSVVDTIATSSLTRYTAASSNGARPTTNDGSEDVGRSDTKSARSDAPHFAAQPPHDVHSVRRRALRSRGVLMVRSYVSLTSAV